MRRRLRSRRCSRRRSWRLPWARCCPVTWGRVLSPWARAWSSCCSRRPSCSGAAGRSSAHARELPHRTAQHVHADRDRHRRRVAVQPRGGARAGAVPGLVPDARRGVGRYFEAAAVIVTLVLLGQVLELRRASARAPRSARSWASRPRPRAGSSRTAREDDVPLAAVRPGDRLRVRPGEKVPWTAS